MSVGRVRLRTMPTDLDLLGHMNNGRYASLFDLGRFDLLIRTGIWDLLTRTAGTPSSRARPITFRKSLELWQRFTVESRLLAHDDRSVYMMHRAVVVGEVYAEMIVRARFLRRSGGIVPHEELFEALHRPDDLPRARAVDPRLGRRLRPALHARPRRRASGTRSGVAV